MNTQTTIKRIPMSNQNRMAFDLASDSFWDRLDLDPSYQRGQVWDVKLKRQLWLSLIQRLPIGSIIVNETRNDEGMIVYRVIDGKQRLVALREWYTDQLSLPREWFVDSDLKDPDSKNDVHFSDLTDASRGEFELGLAPISFYSTNLKGTAEEADLFIRLNTHSVEQDSATIQRAREIASDK